MTTAEYIAQFELAIADGEEKLKIPSFSIPWHVSNKIFASSSDLAGFEAIVNEGNPNLARIIAGSAFGYRCYFSAMMLRPIVDIFVGGKSFLTLGYINFRGDDQFNFKDFILEWAEKPDVAARKRSDLHAWITLSSGEIIDYTLQFATVNLMKANGIGTPAQHAELISSPFIGTVEQLDARQARYYSLGVGEDFARKIGLETLPN